MSDDESGEFVVRISCLKSSAVKDELNSGAVG
jgi:hypothetical protein